MQISAITVQTQRSRPVATRAAPGFARLLDEPVPAEAAAAASAPAPADGIAATAAHDPWRDRQARRHGHAMLQTLARLQLDLLGGAEPAARATLAALAEARPPAADPALEQLLRAIAVRAAVELARSG